MLIEKVSSFISKNQLISKNDHIILALSGGKDSVVLFHILKTLKDVFRFKFSTVHINHGIRGAESDEDENFVLKLCKEHSVSCNNFRLSGFTNKSGENILRKERYSIFEKLLSNNKHTKIATAHHLNDQLETFLMRLFKGSGTKGLLGIPINRPGFIRPMLSSKREDINEFLNANNLIFREDSSNSKTDKLRNQLRQIIVPEIDKVFGENYLQEFQKSHLHFKDLYDENYRSNLDVFKKISSSKKGSVQIFCNKFSKLSFLQKTQFLEYCFSYGNGLTSAISTDQFVEFQKFVQNAQTGTKFIFFGGFEVLKNRNDLIFKNAKRDSHSPEAVDLNENESIKFGDFNISIIKTSNNDYVFNSESNSELINGDNINFPLHIKSWQKGDFFYPFGNKNKQKLSDFFINNKISKDLKSKIPIVLNNDEIVWVAGYRINERYKVKKSTKVVYKLEINDG